MRPPRADHDDVVALRDAYLRAMPSLDPARLVFIDESGFKTSLSRFYGWATRGEKPVIYTPKYGTNITLVGAIAMDGVRTLKVMKGTLNGERFVDFLRRDLGPTLNAGDIVVMDGPRVHRVDGVVQALKEFGAIPLYLPPYSPELNPIEMCWGLMKGWIRWRAPRKVARLLAAIDEAWQRITPTLCHAWIRHCGYAVIST